MVEKVKITWIESKEVSTDWGVKIKTGIKCDKYGDKILTTLSGTKFWKVDQTYYIKVTPNGEFLNFKPATVSDALDLILSGPTPKVGMTNTKDVVNTSSKDEAEW